MCSDLLQNAPDQIVPKALYERMKKVKSSDLTLAIWMYFIHQLLVDVDLPNNVLLILAVRVEGISLMEDEPRFTNYDYSFAVCNLINSAPSPVSCAVRLAEMDLDKFIEKVLQQAHKDRLKYM